MKKTPMKRRNVKRKKSEWARAYHSKERVEFVKSLPCRVPTCAAMSPSENAHAETGGTGRKADYDKILPLCTKHHRELHDHGQETFEAKHEITLLECADWTEWKWLNRGDFPVDGLDY